MMEASEVIVSLIAVGLLLVNTIVVICAGVVEFAPNSRVSEMIHALGRLAGILHRNQDTVKASSQVGAAQTAHPLRHL